MTDPGLKIDEFVAAHPEKQVVVVQGLGFVGESGAGKSTLVDMMTLMLKPRTGTVRIDGVPHDEVDLAS